MSMSTHGHVEAPHETLTGQDVFQSRKIFENGGWRTTNGPRVWVYYNQTTNGPVNVHLIWICGPRKSTKSKFYIAVKLVKVNQGSSFTQTVLTWSPPFSMPSFKIIKVLFWRFGLRPSWSCDHLYKLSFNLPMASCDHLYNVIQPSHGIFVALSKSHLPGAEHLPLALNCVWGHLPLYSYKGVDICSLKECIKVDICPL